MAVFSIEIADADVPRVIGAVCANYNRPDMVPIQALILRRKSQSRILFRWITLKIRISSQIEL